LVFFPKTVHLSCSQLNPHLAYSNAGKVVMNTGTVGLIMDGSSRNLHVLPHLNFTTTLWSIYSQFPSKEIKAQGSQSNFPKFTDLEGSKNGVWIFIAPEFSLFSTQSYNISLGSQ
jgi:hypothetical protein